MSNLSDASVNTTREDMEVSGVDEGENTRSVTIPEELAHNQELDGDGFVMEEDPLEMDENGEYIGPVSEARDTRACDRLYETIHQRLPDGEDARHNRRAKGILATYGGGEGR